MDIPHRRPTRASGLAVVVLAALLAGLAGTAAWADPAVQDTIVIDFTEVQQDFCGQAGLTVRHDYAERSRLTGSRHGADGYVHFRYRQHLRESWTNVDTGASLHLASDGVIQDVSITDNGDGTYTKYTIVPGAARWRDQDNRLVSLDSGLTGVEVVNDANGTPSDPSDDQTLDVRIVRESNGVNSGGGEDVCDFVVAQIG